MQLPKPDSSQVIPDTAASSIRTARDALASLLVGALLLFLILAIQKGENPFEKKYEALSYPAQDLRITRGTQISGPTGPSIMPDKGGRSALVIPIESLPAANVSSIEIDFVRIPGDSDIQLTWRAAGKAVSSIKIEHHGQGVVRVFMERIDGWEGEIKLLGITVQSNKTEPWQLSRVSLIPSGWAADYILWFNSLQEFTPWTPGSINWYRGTSRVESSALPIPIFIGWLVISLLTYIVIFLISKRKRPINLATCGIMVLLVWMVTDSLWQLRLGARALETYDRYFHLSQAEKELRTDNWLLVYFAARVKSQILDNSTRVFIDSKSGFLGMRTAYHLYPKNVYWELKSPGLPPPDRIRDGDLVALVDESEIVFDPLTDTLRYNGDKQLSVQKLLETRAGRLFRVRQTDVTRK